MVAQHVRKCPAIEYCACVVYSHRVRQSAFPLIARSLNDYGLFLRLRDTTFSTSTCQATLRSDAHSHAGRWKLIVFGVYQSMIAWGITLRIGTVLEQLSLYLSGQVAHLMRQA